MATKRRFLTSLQHRFLLASFSTLVFTAFITALQMRPCSYYKITNSVNYLLLFFKPLCSVIDAFLCRWVGPGELMGLSPHYKLIPKHTACWRKACSRLQCERGLLLPSDLQTHFFRWLCAHLYTYCVRPCERKPAMETFTAAVLKLHQSSKSLL